MKRIISIIFISLFTFVVNAQEISISIAPTLNDVFYYQFVSGGVSGNSKFGYNASVEYMKLGVDKISYGLGFSFQRSNVEIVPSPFIEREPHPESINLVSVSFKTVANIKNEYYLSLGPLIDIQLKSKSQQTVDNQTGIGLSFGVGKRLKIDDGLFIHLEPRLWVHNIIPFVAGDLPLRLTVVGIKAGINLRSR